MLNFMSFFGLLLSTIAHISALLFYDSLKIVFFFHGWIIIRFQDCLFSSCILCLNQDLIQCKELTSAH